MIRTLGALGLGFAAGALAVLVLAWALASPPVLELDACLEACAPSGLAVFEANRACYCATDKP